MKPRALPFIDEMRDAAKYMGAEFVLVRDGIDVHSAGYIESILDEAVEWTHGDYIMRLDDAEKFSSAAVLWLKQEEYRNYHAWAFPRPALWPDVKTTLVGWPGFKLFPDFQLRLATRDVKWPNKIHSTPKVLVQLAPVMIEHHAFLCKTYAERQALTAEYETIKTGKLFRPEDANKIMPEDWPNPELLPYDGSMSWCWTVEKREDVKQPA